MSAKKILLALAFVVAVTPAAMAQSAFTTGSAADRGASGYSSPGGSGRGLYDYASGYGHRHAAHHR